MRCPHVSVNILSNSLLYFLNLKNQMCVFLRPCSISTHTHTHTHTLGCFLVPAKSLTFSGSMENPLVGKSKNPNIQAKKQHQSTHTHLLSRLDERVHRQAMRISQALLVPGLLVAVGVIGLAKNRGGGGLGARSFTQMPRGCWFVLKEPRRNLILGLLQKESWRKQFWEWFYNLETVPHFLLRGNPVNPL